MTAKRTENGKRRKQISENGAKKKYESKTLEFIHKLKKKLGGKFGRNKLGTPILIGAEKRIREPS